jgi:hypothetical protein
VGVLIVLAVRLSVPLLIFRRPLLGGVLSFLADAADLVVFNAFGFPDDYQRLDKGLDLYYLSIEMIVALRWAPLPRNVAGVLYLWRVAGAVLFEVTGSRWVLLLFPNLFELWWLLVVIKGQDLSRRATAVWLVVLLVPKLVHEYVLHVWRVLDRYTLVDVVSAVWPG